jgi:AraC-like DNA-binding protein
MITAYGNKKVALKNWKYLPDYYLDKPFSLKELREKVRELLKPSMKTLPSKETFPFEAFGLDPSMLSPNTIRALEFIGSNLSSSKKIKNMTLKGISEVISISPKYLSFLFRKECGQSISDIIAILKIEKAKELLSHKGKDIKEIAHELGYNNPKNFSRFIKKLTGKPPSELRIKNI